MTGSLGSGDDSTGRGANSLFDLCRGGLGRRATVWEPMSSLVRGAASPFLLLGALAALLGRLSSSSLDSTSWSGLPFVATLKREVSPFVGALLSEPFSSSLGAMLARVHSQVALLCTDSVDEQRAVIGGGSKCGRGDCVGGRWKKCGKPRRSRGMTQSAVVCDAVQLLSELVVGILSAVAACGWVEQAGQSASRSINRPACRLLLVMAGASGCCRYSLEARVRNKDTGSIRFSSSEGESVEPWRPQLPARQ